MPKHFHSLVSGIISHKHKYTIIIQCDTNRKLQPFQAVSRWTLTESENGKLCAHDYLYKWQDREAESVCDRLCVKEWYYKYIWLCRFVGNQFQKVAYGVQLSPISIIVTINCAIIREMFGNRSAPIHSSIHSLTVIRVYTIHITYYISHIMLRLM